MALSAQDNPIKARALKMSKSFWLCLGEKTLEQEQFSLIQPLSNSLSGANVATNSKRYFGSLLRRALTSSAAYMLLLKLRSATLNSLSAFVGAILIDNNLTYKDAVFLSVLSVWLVAAGCGAINNYIDNDIDKLMQRTSQRPLPSGRIQPLQALWFGILLIVAGLGISVGWLNLAATFFLSLGGIIYIFIYTIWLKRKTCWGVVIGGLAGSCALLVGSFSVASSVSLAALLFSGLVFLWTPGHFWSLAIKTQEDGKRANIPTLPRIYGKDAASKWAALSNMVLVPVSTIPYLLGTIQETYFWLSLVIGIIVLIANARLYLSPTSQKAWTVFKLSGLHLFILYLAIALDVFI